MKKRICVGWVAGVVVVCLGCQAPAQAASPWGRLQPGQFDVGLRLATFSDSARVEPEASPSKTGRGVEIAIWYPASSGDGHERLQFADYVRHLPQFRQEVSQEALRKWLAIGISGKAGALERRTLEQILAAPMHAIRDAAPAAEKFPLVLWTMRHDTLVAQSVLGEFLASHGYVVAAARYAGPDLPRPWAIKTAEDKLATFATHLQDLELALTSLEKEPYVDAARVAIFTWSYGAELAPRMQLRHENVRLVLGLSSNPLSAAGLYQGAEAASHLEADRLNASYVIMTEKIGTNGQERTAPEILAELPAESYFVSFADLAHGSFNALEGMLPGVWGIEKVHSWSKGGAVAQLGYETLCRAVEAFLDTLLAETEERLDRSWTDDLPEGFVTITRYPSEAAQSQP